MARTRDEWYAYLGERLSYMTSTYGAEYGKLLPLAIIPDNGAPVVTLGYLQAGKHVGETSVFAFGVDPATVDFHDVYVHESVDIAERAAVKLAGKSVRCKYCNALVRPRPVNTTQLRKCVCQTTVSGGNGSRRAREVSVDLDDLFGETEQTEDILDDIAS